jgi:hypothetical protein
VGHQHFPQPTFRDRSPFGGLEGEARLQGVGIQCQAMSRHLPVLIGERAHALEGQICISVLEQICL